MDTKSLIAKIENIKELADECLVQLAVPKSTSLPKNIHKDISKHNKVGQNLDFTIPIRPFIKKYSGGMSGQKKFTLILAYLAKGNKGAVVTLDSIEKAWDKMTSDSLLGMKFNRFYSGQAKDNDWVESKKSGSYNLRPSWMDIFV